MSKLSPSPSLAAIVAFTGCTAAFLVADVASAATFHRVENAARPAIARPVFRAPVQRTLAVRPVVPTFRPSVRPLSIARPMTPTFHPFTAQRPATFPHIGGTFPRLASIGGHFPHPGSIGGTFPHPNTIAGHFPRPGSIGGKFPSTLGHIACVAAPCPNGGLSHHLIEKNGIPGHLGDRNMLAKDRDLFKNRFGLDGAGKLRALSDRRDILISPKVTAHSGALNGFGKNPVETAQDVGKLQQQFKEAQLEQQKKKGILTEKDTAAANAASAQAAAATAVAAAAAGLNPLDPGSIARLNQAQANLAATTAAAAAAKTAAAQAKSDFTAAKKTTADIKQDLTQNKEILNDQIKIAQLQNQLRRAQNDVPVGPIGPGPLVGPVGPVIVGPVGPGPVVVGPGPVVVAPAPIVGSAPVVPVTRVASFPVRTAAPASLPAPGSLGTRAMAPAPVAAQTAPEYVSVAFKQGVSANDMAAFLQAYKLTIVEGPTPDGAYRLRLNEPLPTEQLPQLVDSMKGQTAIVTDAVVS